MDDLKESREESMHRWKFLSDKDKVRESVARLFAPLL